MITSQFAALRAATRVFLFRRPRACASTLSGLRLSSTVAKPEAQQAATAAPKSFVQKPGKKPAFPERLLIYNAGTGKTTWIAFTKLSTVVFFAFGCLVIAPRLHAHPESPWWAAPAAILLTPLPLLLTTTLTAPFVNSIYLHLPAYARSSRALLARFAANPPPDTLLDIRTIRLNGFWKTTGTTVSELRILPKRRLGLANVERVPARISGNAVLKAKGGVAGEGQKGRKEKKGLLQRIVAVFVEPRRRFYINAAEGSRRSAEPGVVEMVMKAVEANSARMLQQQQEQGKR
ncbi:hypothetical protein B0J12DRAFT_651717 [Macrophomina phaseolina]|uniref:Uncharacterized protein n=1 Tax=Macrophomina phaseolina TaxID=35725 RepID=A0ABQ8GKA7_9PEZI|nr:hypothetical protein B0J12DRAFT_651717 [Macrophomina phaseolina]